MPRDTEFVMARELRNGDFGHPQDELPHGRGRVVKILNDSGVLNIECENGFLMKDMNAPVERYLRETQADSAPTASPADQSHTSKT